MKYSGCDSLFELWVMMGRLNITVDGVWSDACWDFATKYEVI